MILSIDNIEYEFIDSVHPNDIGDVINFIKTSNLIEQYLPDKIADLKYIINTLVDLIELSNNDYYIYCLCNIILKNFNKNNILLIKLYIHDALKYIFIENEKLLLIIQFILNSLKNITIRKILENIIDESYFDIYDIIIR
jgi:hypothetical protein